MSIETGRLTVEEAAQVLGVSRKTVLRRIGRGELQGEKEPAPSGGFAWRVWLEPQGQPSDQARGQGEDTPTQGDRTAPGQHQDKDTEREDKTPDSSVKPSGQGDETTREQGQDRDSPQGQTEGTRQDSQGTNEVEMLRAELARERELNSFFRGQIEEGNRNSAELRAALRKALEAMPKALTTGTATAPEAPISRAISPDGVAHTEPVKATQIAIKQPEAARRGGGLKLIRDGLKRVFGR